MLSLNGCVEITSAIGNGSNALSAFDSALYKAGIANLNLIRLSSVIPGNTRLIQVPYIDLSEQCDLYQIWGHRLYAVYAQINLHPGEVGAAGIGWVQDPLTLQGLFVEHHTKAYAAEGIDPAQAEREVQIQIATSLNEVCARRNMEGILPQDFYIEGIAAQSYCLVRTAHATTQNQCILVIAAYDIEAWKRASEFPSF